MRLNELVWGGRVRCSFQSAVWRIAEKHAVKRTGSTSGSMVSSSQTTTLGFLDGGVSLTRGYFDASSGMRWFGKNATAFIIYKLGHDPKELLRDSRLPSLRELESELRLQRSDDHICE